MHTKRGSNCTAFPKWERCVQNIADSGWHQIAFRIFDVVQLDVSRSPSHNNDSFDPFYRVSTYYKSLLSSIANNLMLPEGATWSRLSVRSVLQVVTPLQLGSTTTTAHSLESPPLPSELHQWLQFWKTFWEGLGGGMKGALMPFLVEYPFSKRGIVCFGKVVNGMSKLTCLNHQKLYSCKNN